MANQPQCARARGAPGGGGRFGGGGVVMSGLWTVGEEEEKRNLPKQVEQHVSIHGCSIVL